MSYKAKTTFSFDGKPYNEGDAVDVDESIAEKLLERGQITKGKGKEPEKEKAELSTKETRETKEKKELSDNPGAKTK